MNKIEQLKQSLTKVGIDLDRFQGSEKLTSQILEKIKGGVRDPKNCSYEKTPTHEKHDKCHSKHILHSKCTHEKK
jgi:hypothetical protein